VPYIPAGLPYIAGGLPYIAGVLPYIAGVLPYIADAMRYLALEILDAAADAAPRARASLLLRRDRLSARESSSRARA
jgi:hypothetical protein